MKEIKPKPPFLASFSRHEDSRFSQDPRCGLASPPQTLRPSLPLCLLARCLPQTRLSCRSQGLSYVGRCRISSHQEFRWRPGLMFARRLTHGMRDAGNTGKNSSAPRLAIQLNPLGPECEPENWHPDISEARKSMSSHTSCPFEFHHICVR